MSIRGLVDWRDALGWLSVALAVLAAVIYIAQTLRGEVRPHPLSFFLFGVLSLTGYWVQRDEGARQGSWTLLAMTIICFLFVAASVARGERRFSRTEWVFAQPPAGLCSSSTFSPGKPMSPHRSHIRRRARLRTDFRPRLGASE